MASKKQKCPTVARTPRQPRAPKVTEKTLGESIIEQMQALNVTMGIIATHLADRNSMLSVATSTQAQRDERVVKALETGQLASVMTAEEPHREDTIVHSTQPVATEPPRKKRGRPSKAELAARAAHVTEVAMSTGRTAAEVEAGVEEPAPRAFPKQCPCGVREDVPKHLHAKGCPVHFPSEPVPAHRETTSEPTPPPPAAQATEAVPAPTLDDVRATAIAFVGKHGKEKLAALLQKYAAEKLSSVTTDKLPALLADLQAAG